MDTKTVEWLAEHLQTLQLKPDDILVLSTPNVINDDTAKRLKEAMLLNFPEHKCIVLSHGLKLGVIRGQSDTAVDE
jgi:hypothetical protein